MSEPSLYERVMGDDFHRLDAAVQAFHRLRGCVELHGVVTTFAPASMLARLIARGLGSPMSDTRGAIRFELEAQPLSERWTRHFPARTMTSVLEFRDGRVVENLGLARLQFDLKAMEGGGLSMQLLRMTFAGIPCPRWLMPAVIAEERGALNELHFLIRAALPWGTVVAHYEGHLVLPAGASS